jgi:hypothetical protein
LPPSKPNRGSLAAALFLAALAVAALPAAPARAANRNPHDFAAIGCTHCHLTIPGQSTVITKRVFRKDISELCRECHEDSPANQINHRVGIVPSMSVPEDLHLGERGELTCITCHMPHFPYQDKRTGSRTYFPGGASSSGSCAWPVTSSRDSRSR